MDSITQATLGAAIGHVMLGEKIGWKGAALGGIVATIPDLDVVLLPFYSDLDRISIHRGFSHSIVFSLIGSVLVTLVLKKIRWTIELATTKLWIFAWLALFTHMLLDAFTTYGTQLYLPFSDYRVSFDSINIVDPVYTLPLLAGLILSLVFFRKKTSAPKFNQWGLIISSAYLIGTLGIKTLVEHNIKSQLSDKNLSYSDLLSVSVGFASMNWYGVARNEENLYLGKYNVLENNDIHFDQFAINDQLLNEVEPKLVDRLKWFSKGFYTVAQSDDKIRLYNMQCDMQGVRTFGDYKAPTAFYFEITPKTECGEYELSSGMHLKNKQ